MFEISISGEVNDLMINHYKKQLEKDIALDNRIIFNHAVLTMRKVFRKVFKELKTNPFSFPNLNDNVYFAKDLFLPFVLFYTIQGNKIKIFYAIEWVALVEFE